MSLYNFVYNLQRQPPKAKKAILVGLLGVVFVGLMVLWVFMFRRQLAETGRLSEFGSTAESLLGESENLTSPFSAVVEGFKGLKTDVAGVVGQYRQGLGRGKEKARPVYELPRN